MPSYRGVDQAVVVQSIRDVVDLLSKNSSGPEMDKRLADLTQKDASGQTPVDKIVAAQTDQDMVQAVRESGIQGKLCWISDLMMFHAIKNTDGRGRDIFKAVYSWDGCTGARILVQDAMDREGDAYIKKHSTLSFRFTKASLGIKDAHQRMPEFFTVRKGIRGIADRMRNTFQDAVGFGQLVFSQHLPYVTFGAKSALGRYGLADDDLTAKKINWHDKTCEADRLKVETVLEPFYALEEVSMTGVGCIGSYRKNVPLGIVFESTLRAAEAVAAAFPGRRVLDEEGNVITPPAPKPQPQTPVPQPQP